MPGGKGYHPFPPGFFTLPFRIGILVYQVCKRRAAFHGPKGGVFLTGQPFLVRDKQFYKTFFTLTLFISLQQLITFSVNLADNLMLGAYSETALSGAALVNQIQYLLQTIVSGFSSGVVVLGSQYWGKRDVAPIRRIFSLGFQFSLAAGVIFCLITAFLPRQVLGLLTNDPAVIEQGAIYLSVMCFTYILFAFSNSIIMSLRTVETTMIGPVVSLAALAINSSLNYCLIFGNFGFPKLGILGAAIATCTSRVAELVIVLIYLFLIDKKLKLRPRYLVRPDGFYLKDYVPVTLPIVASSGFWGLAMVAQTAILGHMSAAAIAANSVAGTVFQIASVIAMCSANSSAVVMGKTIGEGRTDMVKPYSRTLQVLFLIIGVASGLVLFLLKDLILGLYVLTPETYALADSFILVLCITLVGSAYEFPVSAGIIMGGGDTKYAFWVDTLFMWCFTIPLSALSAFVWNFPPLVTFIFLKADQILKCLPNAIKCNRYKWIRELTRD